MSTEHTNTKLAHRYGRIFSADRENLTIANIARAHDGDFSEANARRLVACWNACEGTSTEWLEGRASGMQNGAPSLDDQFDKANKVLSALIDAEARLSLLIERDEHKLLDVVSRDKARKAIEAFAK